jgi:hypothetical protein
MNDGSTILVNLKPGASLSSEEEKAIAAYAQFCRERRAKKQRVASRTAEVPKP